MDSFTWITESSSFTFYTIFGAAKVKVILTTGSKLLLMPSVRFPLCQFIKLFSPSLYPCLLKNKTCPHMEYGKRVLNILKVLCT